MAVSIHTTMSMTILTLTVLAVFVHISSSNTEEKHLQKAAQCQGQVLSSDYRYRTLSARSVLECVVHCRPDTDCLSLVFDANDKTCYLGNATATTDCSNMEPGGSGMKYYQTANQQTVVCDTYGEELGEGGTCVCADGFRGNPCTPYIGDCEEGYQKGNFTNNGTSGVFLIHPLQASTPFYVFCKQMPNNVRTYIMERKKKTLSFNRNFADYKAGFGALDGDHWLGLEKVHYLTNSKAYELRASAKLENSSIFFMQYQNFRISDEASGYRLYFNQTTNDTYLLGDCFSALYGAQFSAYDNDNDEDGGVNCAQKHEGGWWFRGGACSTCNPTGPLLQPAGGLRTGVDAEIFWTEDLNDMVPFKMTMFLISL